MIDNIQQEFHWLELKTSYLLFPLCPPDIKFSPHFSFFAEAMTMGLP